MSEQDILNVIGKYKAVLMCGLPGSGKSTLAKKISEKNDAVVLSSDAFREKMKGTTRLDLAGDKKVSKHSADAYKRLYEEAVELLKKGKNVVIDATNVKPERKEYLELLKEITAKVMIVALKTPRESIRERMSQKEGMANEKETFVEAWERVTGYFDEHFTSGKYVWPDEAYDRVRVVEMVG